jgi:hypothetical protein
LRWLVWHGTAFQATEGCWCVHWRLFQVAYVLILPCVQRIGDASTIDLRTLELSSESQNGGDVVFVWDVDETLVVFQSLLDGSYVERTGAERDVADVRSRVPCRLGSRRHTLFCYHVLY